MMIPVIVNGVVVGYMPQPEVANAKLYEYPITPYPNIVDGIIHPTIRVGFYGANLDPATLFPKALVADGDIGQVLHKINGFVPVAA